ncbi:AP2-containing protein [Hordeum vulgare]|nr:AP2-containing protein [Hordeum vulgare]
MPPRKTPKSKTGFFSVGEKPSGNYEAEFTNADHRFWLGTYPIVLKAARAYDIAVWPVESPRKDLNFPKIETKAASKMLVREGICMEEIMTNKKIKKKRPAVFITPGESDEAVMVEQKKKIKEEEEVGPSTVIPMSPRRKNGVVGEVEDDDDDDPIKVEFWDRLLRSDDDE